MAKATVVRELAQATQHAVNHGFVTLISFWGSRVLADGTFNNGKIC